MATIDYVVRVEDKAKLEALLTSSGAKILSSTVLSKTRPRFTRLDTTSTYAEGIEQLQKEAALTENLDPLHLFQRQGSSPFYRPPSFKENLLARIEDYNTLKNPNGSTRTKEERLRLFNQGIDSCTSITSEAGSLRIKIDPISLELITIAEGFKKAFLPVKDFNSAPGILLDTSEGVYSKGLTQSQVPEHPAWLAAVGEDRRILTDYSEIVFTELSERRKKSKGDIRAMGFYPITNPGQNQRRALCAVFLVYDSDAGGYGNLSNDASFLLLAQESAPQAPQKK